MTDPRKAAEDALADHEWCVPHDHVAPDEKAPDPRQAADRLFDIFASDVVAEALVEHVLDDVRAEAAAMERKRDWFAISTVIDELGLNHAQAAALLYAVRFAGPEKSPKMGTSSMFADNREPIR